MAKTGTSVDPTPEALHFAFLAGRPANQTGRCGLRHSGRLLICLLLLSYDEPEILPPSSHPVCLMTADAGQF